MLTFNLFAYKPNSFFKAASKGASYVLALFLLLNPIAPVFAVETNTTRGFYDIAYGLPTVQSSRPDQSSGTFTHQYPITLPPGRNGMTPNISLVYSSNDKSNDSAFGYGWSVSIPYIVRQNKHGSDNLYDYDDFASSEAGELVKVSTTTYYAKVEGGDYTTFKYDNDTWTVYDQSGTRYTYGSATTTRQDDSSDSSRINKWMLNEVRDQNDNYIKYEYYKDDGQIYPATTTYTGHGSTDGIFTVVFNRTSADMSDDMYHAGFEAETNYKISDITINESASWVRKYDLAYTTGDNGVRPLLSTITETGRNPDTGETVTKPATTLTYHAGGMGWEKTTGGDWELPKYLYDASPGDSTHLSLVDVNGDAYPDIIYSAQGDGPPACNNDERTVWINDTLGGWDEYDCTGGEWQPPLFLKKSGHTFPDGGARVFDYDGDLLNDMVFAYASSTEATSSAASDYEVWNNTGNTSSTWTSSTTTVPVSFVFGAGVWADNGTQTSDINGDGLADIVFGWLDDSSILHENVFINNGDGWSEAATSDWVLPWAILDGNTTSYNSVFTFAQLLDFNGDGLTDYGFKHGDSQIDQRVGINTGSSWASTTSWVMPVVTEESDQLDNAQSDGGTRVSDVNGDGIADFMVSRASSTESIHLGTLRQAGDEGATIDYPLSFTLGQHLSNPSVALADLNADGMVDFVYGDADQGYATYLATSTPFTDMLTGINTPEGASTTVSYKMSTQYFDGSNNLMNPNLPAGIVTVESVATDDGMGNETVYSYTYKDGEFYYDNPFDKQLTGFGLVTKTDTEGNVTKTYFHQGNETASTTGEYDDHISKAGRPYRIEQYDDSSNLYSKTINKWDRYDRGSGASFVKLAQSVEFSYDGDSDHKEKAASYSYNNTTGQLLDTKEWGVVSGSNDGTFSDSGTDDFTTSYNYATSTATSTIDFHKVSRETTVDNGSNKVREQYTYYDELSLGSMDEGNPTKMEQWVSGSTYIDIERAYNSYGLVTSSKDPRDNTTTYSYDTNNLYPATTTNPLSQSATYTYDYATGQVEMAIDPNGNQTRKLYDPLGRVASISQFDPTLAPGTLATTTAYTYTDNNFPRQVKTTNYLNSATTTESYTYYDGLSREIETRTKAEESGKYAVNDFFYDNRGLMESQSLPYFASGTAYTGTTTAPASTLLTTYQYDALGRVATASTSVGITTSSYDDWATTVTDALDNSKIYTHDAYGNLTSVVENNGASAYTTTYTYSGNKKLTKITDAEANVRNFTYDGLGRRLTAQDLHDAADGTYGTWTYEYDSAGNIGTTTDPKSQVVVNTYDALNRPLTENYAGDAGTEVSYGYDSCTRGVGHICVATTTDAVTSYAYNALGLVDAETKTVDSASYVTEYDYDRLGNVTNIIYPDDSEVAYVYNNAGQVERMRQKESGGSFTNLIQDYNYGPHGKITYQLFGNNASSTREYDASELYRLRSIITIASSTSGGMGGGGLDHALIEAEFYDSAVSTSETSGAAEEVTTETEEVTATETEVVGDETTSMVTDSEETENAPEVATSTPGGEVAVAETSTTSEPSVAATSTSPTSTTTPIVANEVEENTDVPSATTTATSTAAVETETATTTEAITPEVASSTPLLLETPTDKLQKEPAYLGSYEDRGDHYELPFLTGDKTKAKAVISKNSPAVRLQKWNGEVDLGVSYSGVSAPLSVASGTNMFKWQGGAEEVHAYPLEKGNGMEDGGFEIEVILNEAPKKNTFTFNIDGYKDLDFLYQPPLDKENSLYDCTATTCVDETGAIVDERPESVVGSYAVYHKTKKDIKHGETNYKTGKVFHIYRPEITDAKANSTWGQLSYQNGKLTVTVPQEFLDTAAYPVVVDPTFGYTSVGASYGFTGSARGTIFTTSETGDLSDIVIYTASETGNTDIGAAVYSDNSGSPNALLTSHTAAQTRDSTPAWVTVPVSALAVTGSTNYWLWGWSSSAGRRVNWDTGSSNQHYMKTGMSWPSWASSMSSGSFLDRVESIYAVYSTANAPTEPTGLLTEGLTNPTNLADRTPEFSAIYNDPNADDIATHYQIQVATSTAFTDVFWDTSQTSLASSTQQGQRVADISYAGSELTSNTTYYWRVKFWDDGGLAGSWSTTTASFSLAPSVYAGTDIQNIAYTYDAVGNIKSIINSASTAAQQSEYVYDDLYRLTTATTTATLSNSSLLVNIDPDAIDSDLTDFPIYVDLSDFPAAFWEVTNCTDIRVYKTGTLTELPREIVSCTDNGSSGTGELWIKYSGALSSTVDTDILITFDGSSPDYAPDANYGSEAVWTDYEAVFHAGETSGNLLDSGSEDNDLTDNNTVGATASGKISSARDFEETTSEFFNSTTDAVDTTGDLEGTMWVNLESTPGGALHTRYDGDNGQAGLTYLTYYDKTNNRFWMRTRNGASELDAYVSYTLPLSTWAKVTTQYDQSAGTFEAFVNGTSAGSDNGLATTLAYQDGAFSVGAWDTDQGGAAEWDGLMDEMRFSTTLHSSAWQDAEYTNQSDPASFYSVGSTSVSTSSASYLGLFAYTAIGNIASTSDSGDYAYSETGKANPSAATTIGSGTLTYDDNGNLLTYASSTYSWDYRNRMTESSDGTANTTYGYDHSNQRVLKTASSTTIVYPNQYYSVEGATSTKYIYAGSELVATVEGTGTTTINYVHIDHLGSTNVVTDEYADVVQVLDYYPYGSERIATGENSTDRHYIGERYDFETELNYLNARYYESARGQFLSQDPSFWKMSANLMLDPQLQNSYGYARNNPIIYKDPNGDIPVLVVTAGVGAVIGGVSGVAAQAVGDYVTGNDFKASNYTGAFVGGAVQGGLIGSGVGLFASGAAGGFAQGVTREGVDAYNGEGFEYEGVVENTVTSALLGPVAGKVKGPAVAGITAGRNSMSAVARSTATKMANGTINSYTLGTAGKIGTSYAVGGAYGTAADIAMNGAYNVARSGNLSSASSYLGKAASAVAKGNLSAASNYLGKAAKALRQ